MASKSYTLLEYLITIETELKKLKKIVAESVGSDYSELIAQINGIGNELNSFKTSITNTVDNNNTNLTSKLNSLEQQFNTFKTSITNTVNTNNTSLLSKVNSLETQFNSFKTSITNINERVTNVENRVTTLESNSGSQSETIVEKPIKNAILNLGTEKYQKCIMEDLTQINLPNVSSFTEIHLFFSTTEALTLVLPSCKWQNQPTISANKEYEFIFTYVGEWLGGYIVYE